ncbi:MAG: HPP family protein [Inhella sp.]
MRERARAALGALLGLLATALITAWLAPASPWLVAPLGASAVLVFAVPASPLAQPWAVLGGNGLSALLGVGVMQLGCPHRWRPRSPWPGHRRARAALPARLGARRPY